MTITSNTISNFTLKTPCGRPIFDRFCCKDDIVISWNINTSDCSDFSGKIELTNLHNSHVYSFPLQQDTSDHKFCFCSCNDIAPHENYTLHFERICSDQSDVFDINLTRFKTLADAGSDKSILFGATTEVGVGSPESHTIYAWDCSGDFASDCTALTTLVRPCKTMTYRIIATDSDFSNCWASDTVQVTVATPTITWSDVHHSDGGETCTFRAWLTSSDTYTNSFHITLKNLTTGSDIADFYSDTPFYFTQTVNKPIVPGTTQYKLMAALSDFEGCSDAVKSQNFSCIKAPEFLPAGPSTFEMLFKVFGFLILFILLGLTLNDNM